MVVKFGAVEQLQRRVLRGMQTAVDEQFLVEHGDRPGRPGAVSRNNKAEIAASYIHLDADIACICIYMSSIANGGCVRPALAGQLVLASLAESIYISLLCEIT